MFRTQLILAIAFLLSISAQSTDAQIITHADSDANGGVYENIDIEGKVRRNNRLTEVKVVLYNWRLVLSPDTYAWMPASPNPVVIPIPLNSTDFSTSFNIHDQLMIFDNYIWCPPNLTWTGWGGEFRVDLLVGPNDFLAHQKYFSLFSDCGIGE